MEPRNDSSQDDKAQRDAASRVVRDQLDAIYGSESRVVTPQRDVNPRQKQYGYHSGSRADGDPWQQYHSQWQEYYQRYYENYYVGHLHQALKDKGHSEKPLLDSDLVAPEPNSEVEMLRQKIVDKAKDKATKARKSRHFVPIISALVVVVVVAFLQYNQIVISNVQAYVSPGAIDPQNIVVDPNSGSRVSAEPRLIIPKINVDVPVIYGVGYDHDSQMAAMQKGVAHFAIPGANSVPGQLGNTVFSGHSSNDIFGPGDYKFIFAQLDKLTTGDTIYVNYNNIRYSYTITSKQIVKPSNVQALLGMNDKPYLTLITCTPLGTALNRLLIKAEQVTPDPAKAKPAAAVGNDSKAAMPGNGPTLIERLFGAR